MIYWGADLLGRPWGDEHFNAWRSLNGTGFQVARENMTLEATLVHVRNLTEFYACEPVQDDIVATHFHEDWEPVRLLSDDERKAINKRLQHLTYERTVDHHGYPMLDWCRAILDAQRRLVELVDTRDRYLAAVLALPDHLT